MKLKFIVAAAALLAIGQSSSAVAQVLVMDTGTDSGSASSWVAGAQAGYNWQRDWLVYGLEADISGMHLNPQVNTVLQGSLEFPPLGSANSAIDWYGTLRGRAGWSSGPWLLYATAGLAYGRIDLNNSLSNVPASISAQQTSSERAGWVAGGGLSYLWTPNVVLSLEYQYLDLGSINLALSAGSPPLVSTQSASANGRFQVVTAGLSWLFTPAGKTPGAPWQGGYVGGHVGGAWGDDTTASYSASATAIPVSDIRLKRDVVLMERLDDGLGLYRYRYLWSDTVYVGVMAQEVALLRPDAIVRSALDPYLRVNYARLGLTLMTLPQWQSVSQGRTL
jgi:outer membrane immunogenic protein